eukprot:TRINITY_DN5312_c0_g1_i1.p1 TRINITY_DN5312_c0_g1~~TRINITY_DN5312_c0_g1_i1.p1  ORF type:complete len:202 (-),score=37.44 TRINITY_DN5312_c0_g1_i1:72-629(-)
MATAACGTGGAGNIKLTVNKQTRRGSVQVVLECSPQDIVKDVCDRLSEHFVADLRHKGTFDNLPNHLSLQEVGISQDMEVTLFITCCPKEPPSAPAATEGAAGNIKLTVNKRRQAGIVQVVLECSPQDIVGDVCDRLSEHFVADLRSKGSCENLPKHLSLIDVGISQDMEVDLFIQCCPKEPPSQ